MQVAETTRLPTPGGATGPPVLQGELPVLLAPAAADGQAATRRVAFGRRLTAARERHGVALADIARSMKVSTTLLAGLERGDASKWPKGLFRRAFFRDYAAAIGLAPDSHVSEFLQLFPDGEDHPVAPTIRGEADSAPTLRLALAPGSGWHISRGRIVQELASLAAVVLVASTLTLSTSGSFLMFAGAVALCYYGRLAGAAPGRSTLVWRHLRERWSALRLR
jgi:transcriptional regulator with XRE-family HTH domain